MLLKMFFGLLNHKSSLVPGSVGASRENTPPYRSISYPPPGPDTTSTKGPSVRSASWTSEIPIMPPLSVNVGPEIGIFHF